MEVNYFGLVATTKAFLPLARAHRGRIVNMCSMSGLIALGSDGIYSASKFAVEGFSDSLRKELRPLGVAVVLINPAVVITPIWNKPPYDFPIDEQALSLYGPYFDGIDDTVAKLLASGDTTQVTDDAVVDAVANSRPQARYFVANVGGVPAVILAFLARVLPTHRFDLLLDLA